jgi:hypothetical protein
MWLEEFGEAPEDAELSEWQLAQKTSWWGKRLDASSFWSNRVVWLDSSADSAARRHGRLYPPVPAEDPKVPRFKGDDEDLPSRGGYEIEGPNLRLRTSNFEARFWDRFNKTHPRPPNKLKKPSGTLQERPHRRNMTAEIMQSTDLRTFRGHRALRRLGPPGERSRTSLPRHLTIWLCFGLTS